ncbi:superoxide dismutase family protein [Celerinatantimonas sp. YJH-8]|uniref:superoxide dismutase family protein n=1 Tax=Celerinatantimonas sp. YJH-8 TaxID=3228714 RepID=UPI0038C6451A
MSYIRFSKTLIALTLFGTTLATSTVAQAADALKATISAYPDTHAKVRGHVAAKFNSGYVTIRYNLTGLTPNANGGLHIHAGTSCKTAKEVGGHYFAPKDQGDYWKNANWVSDSKGHAKGSFRLLSGLDRKDNLHHAVVVHDSHGDRIGCGILQG